MVDNPLDEGRDQKLVAAEISNVFCNREGYFGVARVVGNSLERDGSRQKY